MTKKEEDYTGRRIGFLQVEEQVPPPEGKRKDRRYWKCTCLKNGPGCKKTCILPTYKLNGDQVSCGCSRRTTKESVLRRENQQKAFQEMRANLYQKILNLIKYRKYSINTTEEEFIHFQDPYRDYLSVTCPNGHTYPAAWLTFVKEKHFCRDCERVNYLDSRGWVLLDHDEATRAVTAKCKAEGHIKTKPELKQFNNGCFDCQHGISLSTIQTEKMVSSLGYKFIRFIPEAEVIPTTWHKVPIEVECSSGHPPHKFPTSRYALLKGSRCPKLVHRCHTSRGEQELNTWLQSCGYFCSKENFKDLKDIDLEIDAYIESHKLGIEHHGLFWHSSQKLKNEDLHLRKYWGAKKLGIKLFQFFEDEWEHKQEIVKALILKELNLKPIEKFLDLQLTQLLEEEYKEFCNKNHTIIPPGELFFTVKYNTDKILLVFSQVENRIELTPALDISWEQALSSLLKLKSDFQLVTNNLLPQNPEKFGFSKYCELAPEFFYIKGYLRTKEPTKYKVFDAGKTIWTR